MVSRAVGRSLEERKREMSHQLEAARAATARGNSLTAEVSTAVHTPAASELLLPGVRVARYLLRGALLPVSDGCACFFSLIFWRSRHIYGSSKAFKMCESNRFL